MPSEKLEYDLEEMVDQLGLDALLSALSDICCEKSLHVEETRGDAGLARAWDMNATLIDKLIPRLADTE